MINHLCISLMSWWFRCPHACLLPKKVFLKKRKTKLVCWEEERGPLIGGFVQTMMMYQRNPYIILELIPNPLFAEAFAAFCSLRLAKGVEFLSLSQFQGCTHQTAVTLSQPSPFTTLLYFILFVLPFCCCDIIPIPSAEESMDRMGMNGQEHFQVGGFTCGTSHHHSLFLASFSLTCVNVSPSNPNPLLLSHLAPSQSFDRWLVTDGTGTDHYIHSKLGTAHTPKCNELVSSSNNWNSQCK